MRKSVVAILIFLAGWGLGWMTHHYRGTVPQKPVRSPVPAVVNSDVGVGVADILQQDVPVQGADLVLLLQRNDFAAALERYESLQRQADDAALTQARAQILVHASRLINGNRFSLAEQLLQGFLVADYRDVEARILLAEAYQGQQDLLAAIDQLYEARGYAWRPEVLQRISGRIRTVVAGLAQSLQRNGDRNGLLALYQRLIQMEPDHAPWFMELAAAQLALDDREAARRTLLLVAQDPDIGAQAQAMLAELRIAFADAQDAVPADAGSGVGDIPLVRSGNHFLVEARPANGPRIQLLIDTGASLTILTPAVLEQRDIRYRDTGRTAVFNTANGPVRGPVYQLEFLAVGDWQVNRLEIGVLDLGSRSAVDGLLGMNFLSNFQFFIDQNEGVLRLSANQGM